MINHVRTLLLNADPRERRGDDYPGEEFVPDDAKRRNLTGLTGEVWADLFGGLDRAGTNLCLRVLLGVSQSAGLGDFLVAKDRRVTYPPFNDVKLRQGPYRQVAFETDPDLQTKFLGDLQPNDRTYNEFSVQIDDSSHATVTGFTASSEDSVAFSVVGGRTTPIPLGNGLSVTLAPLVGARADLEIFSLPFRSVTDRFKAAASRIRGREGSFFDTPELLDIYEKRTETVYRMASLAVETANRIDRESNARSEG